MAWTSTRPIVDLTVTESASFTGFLAATLTADVNDWAPAGAADATVWRVTPNNPYRAISGIAAGTNGRVVTLVNTGTVPLLLRRESTLSVAANRLALTADQRIEAGASVTFIYDGAGARWVPLTPLAPDLADPTTPWVVWEDFIATSTETGEIGMIGLTTTNGTVASATQVAGNPGILTRTSGTVAAQVASMTPQASAATTVFQMADWSEFTWRGALVTTGADFTVRFGVCSSPTASPPASGLWVERTNTDTSFFGVARATGVQTRTAALVAQDLNYHTFRCRRISDTSVGFQADRGAEQVVSTNVPVAGTGYAIFHQIVPTTVTARSHNIDFLSTKGVASSVRW